MGPNYIGNISERHSKIAGDLFSTGSLQLATENMGTLSSTDEELIRDTAMGNIADILEEQFGTTLAYTTAIELSQDLQIDDLIILAEGIKDNSVQENLEIIPKEARALSPEDLEDIIGWSVESTEDSAAAQELNDVWGLEFEEKYIAMEKNTSIPSAYKRTIKARHLLKLICNMQQKTGMPYIMHADACNLKSNRRHLGYIRSGNLCLEVIEYSSEDEIPSCNLASLSVRKFIRCPYTQTPQHL